MPALRVFLSFDLEHDRDLCELLLADSKRSVGFAVTARSEGGALDDAWSERARERIAAADEVVVLCGEHTGAAPRVGAELRIAQEQKKPYVLLWGRRERMCTKPRNARLDDGMYGWSSTSLDHQLSSAWRRNRATHVPDSMKRHPPRA